MGAKKKSYSYEYPRPALTVDCVIFGLDDGKLKILLIERGLEPYKGRWAFPGGFVDMEETIDAAAMRELQEETGLKNVFMEQLCTFGGVDRDPRGRVVSVAYFALVNKINSQVKAGDDASNAKWFTISETPQLAFDHDMILRVAFNRLKGKIKYQPIGFELLPEKFTLSQLQHLYEVILETSIDKRNFRKKILGMGLLIELDEKEENVSHRAASYYKFDKKKYIELSDRGFNFEI